MLLYSVKEIVILIKIKLVMIYMLKSCYYEGWVIIWEFEFYIFMNILLTY